jgi:hypothetical protein
MGNFGIRISKDGVDAGTPLTDTNKKDFTFVSDESSPKIYYSGFVEGADPFSGMTYTHNLGYVPIYFMFVTDSVTNPTYYSATRNTLASTSVILETIGQYGYLIILSEGS